jgi:hypothetical protein
MNNVIKFQKPKPVKPPRQTPPWLRRVAIGLVTLAAFTAVWVYFQMTQSTVTPGL